MVITKDLKVQIEPKSVILLDVDSSDTIKYILWIIADNWNRYFLAKYELFAQNNRNYYDAAEVYSNLASEMMFNENESFNKAMAYFQKALKIFENIPNWKLAYVKNNLAILYILYKGDFETAASLLEDALLVGMSSFTYFTIYLNLCMCYLLLRGHESTQFCSAYSSFNKYHELIASRKNATQYDDIYKQIVELIILEHSGHADKANARARSILPLISSSFFIPILLSLIHI